MAAVVVAQFAPRLHERGAVPRDVGEVPVKAALGHFQTTAQPVDLSAFMPSSAKIAKPAWIQSSTDNLLFVVARALPMSRSLRPATPLETDASTTFYLSLEYDSASQSGVLAY
jgi:hypothetical protein